MNSSRKEYFKNKRITMMGLGLLGRGINVAKFLAQNGAKLTITDLKSADKLKSSLGELSNYKDIKFVLGEHRLEDFRDCDMVIKAAGVPLESIYIDEAYKNGVRVEMDASLFAQLVPDGVTIIGVTGTRGKSTTTQMIYHLLKTARKRVFLGGNVRGLATLPLLNEVKTGDFVVLELDSWQLQGFGEAKISPQIGVFTNLMDDHMNYYKGDREKYFADKANIFINQKSSDVLVAGEEIGKKIEQKYRGMAGRLTVVTADYFPKTWLLKILGDHNRQNAGLALAVGRELKISDQILQEAFESFEPIEGRLQFVGEKNGVKIFNDNNATTPEATAAGIKAVADEKNVHLIAGGTDKGLELKSLAESINKHCRSVTLISGTGTEKLKTELQSLNIEMREVEELSDAIDMAVNIAKKGEVILFSPAFASFSKYFENEYERNDLFMKIIKEIGFI